MQPERVVLVTGFEPFGGMSRNVSIEAARALDGRSLAGARRVARELPVVWPRAREVLSAALDELRPAAVVSFGIHAENGGPFRIEELAANQLDFRIPDNAGAVLTGVIEADGPRERRASIDPLALGSALLARGLTVRLSRDAGRYLCNATYYALLGRAPRAAFIHVPPRNEGEPLDDIIIAVEAAASVAARVTA
jgi:pyroglutamyl-peptidase